MLRYVLTGTPGSGKTAILRQLEHDGFAVVEEAATDVIALWLALGEPDPSTRPDFIDKILMLQRHRERLARPAGGDDVAVFFDRSPVCTLALSRFLGQHPSALLSAEVDRVLAERVYDEAVFFVRSQGFVTPTAARRLTLTDALAFEKVHERTYRELGFTLIEVPAGPLLSRTELVRRQAEALAGSPGAGEPVTARISGQPCRRDWRAR
jgi:predicted ATPase